MPAPKQARCGPNVPPHVPLAAPLRLAPKRRHHWTAAGLWRRRQTVLPVAMELLLPLLAAQFSFAHSRRRYLKSASEVPLVI